MLNKITNYIFSDSLYVAVCLFALFEDTWTVDTDPLFISQLLISATAIYTLVFNNDWISAQKPNPKHKPYQKPDNIQKYESIKKLIARHS